jgi:hypothetical protein
MKNPMTFLLIAALTATLSATSIKPQDSHEVKSSNGKFTLQVDAESGTHKVTGEFASGLGSWEFKHDASQHQFFVSDDGQAAAVVHWHWCGGFGLELDSPAVVIYGRTAVEGGGRRTLPNGDEIFVSSSRPGVLRSYTYSELSKPRQRKPDEIGPIGDFWRVWRGEATIKGNVLTIDIEGGMPRVIDLRNPQDLPALETAQNTNRNSDDTSLTENENPKIDPAFLELKAREKEEIEAAFPALKTLLGTITGQSQLKVLGNHFGLMGQTIQGAEEEKTPEPKRAVEERRGGSFYVNPYKLTAEDAESIKTIIRDIRSYSKTTDPLARAGFNSCYALLFETNGSVTEIQISTGNLKIRAFHKEVDIYSYLTPEADKKLHSILGKYGLP